MVLRTSSAPILQSWMPQYSRRDSSSSSPETDFHPLQRTKSLSLTSSIFDHHNSPKKQQQKPISETNHKNLPQASSSTFQLQTLFSVSDFGESDKEVCEVEDSVPKTMVMGSGLGGNGGKICGGGDGRDGGGSFERSDSNNHDRNSSADVYYQKMIEANPDNPLLLGNYAKFLKEVKGDYSKAEEFCGRAILANPNDGNVLSLYADLIWETQRDVNRAEFYFKQAVQTSPDDCYVLASYAKFLWDAEEGETEECEVSSPPEFLYGVSNYPPPPLAAAS